MIIYEINVQNEVFNKIVNIEDYIFRTTFSKEISKKIIKNIVSGIYSLAILPDRFINYNPIYKVMNIKKSYRIFYRIDENKKIVTVVNIFSSNEDYSNKII